MNKSHLTDESRLEIDRRVCDGIESWGSFVSEICVVCGELADDKYRNPIDRYWLRGNYCQKCNNLAYENVIFHRQHKDTLAATNLLDAISTHDPLPESHVALEWT